MHTFIYCALGLNDLTVVLDPAIGLKTTQRKLILYIYPIPTWSEVFPVLVWAHFQYDTALYPQNNLFYLLDPVLCGQLITVSSLMIFCHYITWSVPMAHVLPCSSVMVTGKCGSVAYPLIICTVSIEERHDTNNKILETLSMQC